MSYLVAVVSDRIKAEEGYTALEKASLPMDKIAIENKYLKTFNANTARQISCWYDL